MYDTQSNGSTQSPTSYVQSSDDEFCFDTRSDILHAFLLDGVRSVVSHIHEDVLSLYEFI